MKHSIKNKALVLICFFSVIYCSSISSLYSANLIDNPYYILKLHNSAKIKSVKDDEDLLEMYNEAYAELKLKNKLSESEGAIMFWVRPRWPQGDNKSHTFLSSQWSEKDKSYFIISQDWWEPAGKERLYFILSNMDYFYCSTPTRIESNTWTMVTVTWKSGKDGFCGIYLNDEKRIIKKLDFNGKRIPIDKIILGNDSAVNISEKRNADVQFRGLRFFKKPLSHTTIYYSYLRQIKSYPYLVENIWSWIKPEDNLKANKENKINSEPRIIFDEGLIWALSRANTDRVINRISDAGFNVYIPSVWHGEGAYYPNDISHLEKSIKSRINHGEDPLMYLINKAHEKNIEVHPWFTVMYRTDNKYPEFYDEGTPKNTYNVHLPKFRNFIVRLMLDLVNRYPVDGINLDYIRTAGVCTSRYCIADYKNKYNYNLNDDYLRSNKQPEAMQRIQEWQDNAVLDIVRRVSNGAHKIKHNIIVSVDGHPRANNRRDLEGRDSVRWANDNLVDVIFNMDYSKMVDVKNINKVRGSLNNPNKLFTLFSNWENVDQKIIPKSESTIKKYISLSRSQWGKTGIAVYLYSMLSDAQIKMLKQYSFKHKVETGWRKVHE